METKILLSLLLILFGIFCQESESLSERNIDKSPDRHIRKKRVIDILHNRDERVFRQEVRYIVPLLKENGDVRCTGIILRTRIILTAAHCVFKYPHPILVGTGGSRNAAAITHRVIGFFVHEGFNQQSKKNDLALVILNEPIDLIHSFHRPIELYEGNLPPNSHGLFSGWGSTTRLPVEFPFQPLSIIVPILNQQQCQSVYRNMQVISSHEICTHVVNRTKCCWLGDSGGPLVVSGRLIGLLSWYTASDRPQFPDVFMNLMDSGYKSWVETYANHYHEVYHR